MELHMEMDSPHEKIIAKCQAIKCSMKQSKDGLFIGFLLKEVPPQEEYHKDLLALPLGSIVNLYVSVDEI